MKNLAHTKKIADVEVSKTPTNVFFFEHARVKQSIFAQVRLCKNILLSDEK